MKLNKYLSAIGLLFIFALGSIADSSGGMLVSGITSNPNAQSGDRCYNWVAGMNIQNSGAICWWDAASTANGKINVIKATTFSGTNGFSVTGPMGSNYVPYTSVWKMMYYICPLAVDPYHTKAACTIKASSASYESTVSNNISSTSTLGSQTVDFTTGNGSIPANSSICYALKDVNNPSIIWRSSDARMCSDAHTLPATPSTCYLNYQEVLNVDLGTLERSTIATTAHAGDKGNVSKPIQILCTRDGGVTVKTTFQYTAIAINGVGVVSTANNALGVAIIYKGKVVTPSSSFQETFKSGYTTVNLEFEAVRDAAISTDKLPTGAFTASAVMVMTEQ